MHWLVLMLTCPSDRDLKKKTFVKKHGDLFTPMWVDLPRLRIREKYPNMWAFEKKIMKNEEVELYLEDTEKEHPSENDLL